MNINPFAFIQFLISSILSKFGINLNFLSSQKWFGKNIDGFLRIISYLILIIRSYSNFGLISSFLTLLLINLIPNLYLFYGGSLLIYSTFK